MSPRTISKIVALSALAIGSWYLARSNSTDDDKELLFDPVHRGYYLKHARILGTGENANFIYRQ